MAVRTRPIRSERGGHAAEVDRAAPGQCCPGGTPPPNPRDVRDRSAMHADPHDARPAPQFPIRSVGNHIMAPSEALTSALRGWPLARCVIWPPGPSTRVVGVRLTSSL